MNFYDGIVNKLIPINHGEIIFSSNYGNIKYDALHKCLKMIRKPNPLRTFWFEFHNLSISKIHGRFWFFHKKSRDYNI